MATDPKPPPPYTPPPAEEKPPGGLKTAPAKAPDAKETLSVLKEVQAQAGQRGLRDDPVIINLSNLITRLEGDEPPPKEPPR